MDHLAKVQQELDQVETHFLQRNDIYKGYVQNGSAVMGIKKKYNAVFLISVDLIVCPWAAATSHSLLHVLRAFITTEAWKPYLHWYLLNRISFVHIVSTFHEYLIML